MVALSVVVLWLCVCVVAAGQDGGQPKSAPGEEAAGSVVEGRPVRVRLPAYFAAVVTPAQREQIYKVQLRYLDRVEDLQRQIAALEMERDKELDGLLTPDQLAEVQKRRAAAGARRRPGEPPAAEGDSRPEAAPATP